MCTKTYAVRTLLMTFWLLSCPIISYCHVHPNNVLTTHIVIGPVIHRRLISCQASVKIVSERICRYAYIYYFHCPGPHSAFWTLIYFSRVSKSQKERKREGKNAYSLILIPWRLRKAIGVGKAHINF